MAGNCGIRASLYVAVVATAVVLAGCGSTSAGTSGSAATGGAAAATAHQTTVIPVALHLAEGGRSISAPRTTIAGTVTRGASVAVNGHSTSVHSGRWHDTLQLHIGDNPIKVAATMAGRAPASTAIHITRRHGSVELEALARTRALRAQAAEHRAAEARERKERDARTQHALAECTNGTYVNAAGNTVCKPVTSATQASGATAECEDGTFSFSESRSGTCSHHGGVKRWLNE